MASSARPAGPCTGRPRLGRGHRRRCRLPLPSREREGPAPQAWEGEGAVADLRTEPPHLPIASRWAPSSPARGEVKDRGGDMGNPLLVGDVIRYAAARMPKRI